MSLELPQELIDAIIDYLSTDSPSLKACSLVRRLWLSRSRSHLFGTCYIDPENILAFRDLLRFPHGCTFVRHVHSIRARRCDWSPNDPYFDEIQADLLLLTGVHTLELALYIVHSKNMDRCCRKGIVESFPHTTRLVLGLSLGHQFEGERSPITDIISNFPVLQELHIRQFSGFRVTGSAAAAVPPQSLRSLHLNVSTTSLILSWLHACNHLPNVDSLTLPPLEREHAPVVRAALQQLGGALHYLDITIGLAFDVDTLTVFDFSLHPNFRTLAIRAFGDTKDLDSNGVFSLISRLAAPTLECFAFIVHLNMCDRSFNWATVDAFLTSARFPALRNVVFGFHGRLESRKFLPREALPLLDAAGVLEIIWEVDPEWQAPYENRRQGQ